jgi:chromate transporter
MEHEVVARRGWLTREKFLDLVGATNLIPGPNSTELAIPIGWHRARWLGLLVAGACFILPAAVIVIGFARAYVRFGQLPQTTAVLYGVKPVIIAIVIQALWRLARTAICSRGLVAVAAIDLILLAMGADELLVFFGTWTLLAFTSMIGRERPVTLASIVLPMGLPWLICATPVRVRLDVMFFIFLKIGSVDVVTMAIAMGAAVVLVSTQLNPLWLILLGGTAGLVLKLLR